MSTLMHNCCGKMLNVTKHWALFALTTEPLSPQDTLQVRSRQAGRQSTTQRLRLYSTQMWQQWRRRRQVSSGTRRVMKADLKMRMSVFLYLFAFFLCTDTAAEEKKKYHPLKVSLSSSSWFLRRLINTVYNLAALKKTIYDVIIYDDIRCIRFLKRCSDLFLYVSSDWLHSMSF